MIEKISLLEVCEDMFGRKVVEFIEDGEKAFLPTQEEIELGCQEIRRGWSEAEHRRRAGMPFRKYKILFCKTPPGLLEKDTDLDG